MEGYLGIYSDGTVAEPPPLDPPPTIDIDEELDDGNSPTFEPFKDLCKQRFLWYYPSYLATLDLAEKKHTPGQHFKTMPFEGASNTMPGKFEYPELRRRLVLIRQVLDQETSRWAEEGAVLVRRDHTFPSHLFRQFSHLVETYKKNEMVTLDIDIETKTNPFIWIITYFGRPMTQLDGGMFKIRIHISPRFPDEQPRVQFLTKLFHHRVGTDGTLCYFAKRQDDLLSHVDGIVEAVEEETPPYDPRTLVNLEASRLFWGGEADKKQYNRRLRRDAQRSME